MSDDASSPELLVAEIREGLAGAEARLIGRYGRGVAFVLRRSTRDPDQVLDLYQETFRLAIEKLRRGELREPEKLGGYLAGLARNLASDDRRQRARRGTDPLGDALERLPETAPSQLGRLLRGERAALVRSVLGDLTTDRDRLILQRFYLADEPKEEVCAELGLSHRHFDRVLHRAKQRYRRAYEERVGGGRS